MLNDTFKRTGTEGFDVSMLQMQRAYLAHFGRPMVAGMYFADAAEMMVKALGERRARRFVRKQSNNV